MLTLLKFKPIKLWQRATDRGFNRENFKDDSKSYKFNGCNYLLVIGIDKYQHTTKLNNAVRDAKAFRDILLDRYQFLPDYTVELFDKDASRRNILGVLGDLENRIKKEDNFILYYSGHGIMNQRKTKGFWVPVDAKTQADYIPNSRIKDHLDEIHAHHIYLIVDSCFSGSLVARSTEYAERVESLPSRRVLTSGRSEVVSDGKIGSHSPFANSLFEYLKVHDGSLSASRLEQHVKENTPRTAEQTPSSSYIYGLGDQGGEFVFHPKRNEETDWRIAKQKHTVQSYNQYLDRYPEAKYFDSAMNAIKGLEDSQIWKSTLQKNTTFAYRSFLQNYPESPYKEQARLRLNELLENEKSRKSPPSTSFTKKSSENTSKKQVRLISGESLKKENPETSSLPSSSKEAEPKKTFPKKSSPPIWFWIISGICSLWNLLLVYSYIEQVTMTPEAMAALPESYQATIQNIPSWVKGANGISVFAGAIGALSLLMRKAWAINALLLSLLGMLAREIYFFSLPDYSLVFVAITIGISAAFVLFARKSRAKAWIG